MCGNRLPLRGSKLYRGGKNPQDLGLSSRGLWVVVEKKRKSDEKRKTSTSRNSTLDHDSTPETRNSEGREVLEPESLGPT